MKLPPFVSRLVARLALLASVLFALSSWPCAAAALIGTYTDAGALGDLESEEEEVTLSREAHHDERHVARAAPEPYPHLPSQAARAVPFVPPQHVTEAPPRPPYHPLERMLC